MSVASLGARLVTADELAAIVRMRPSTVKRWARLGKIPCVKINRQVLRFDADAVRKAIASWSRDAA